MTWFAWKSGTYLGAGNIDTGPPWTEELEATFMHGYSTEAEANANPNAPLTVAQAGLVQQVKATQAVVGGPAGSNESSPLTPGGALNTLPGAIGKLFSNVESRQFWIRALRVVVGIVLIADGLRRLTGASPTGAVVGAAKKAIV